MGADHPKYRCQSCEAERPILPSCASTDPGVARRAAARALPGAREPEQLVRGHHLGTVLDHRFVRRRVERTVGSALQACGTAAAEPSAEMENTEAVRSLSGACAIRRLSFGAIGCPDNADTLPWPFLGTPCLSCSKAERLNLPRRDG